jgi:hypothetical protein
MLTCSCAQAPLLGPPDPAHSRTSGIWTWCLPKAGCQVRSLWFSFHIAVWPRSLFCCFAVKEQSTTVTSSFFRHVCCISLEHIPASLMLMGFIVLLACLGHEIKERYISSVCPHLSMTKSTRIVSCAAHRVARWSPGRRGVGCRALVGPGCCTHDQPSTAAAAG